MTTSLCFSNLYNILLINLGSSDIYWLLPALLDTLCYRWIFRNDPASLRVIHPSPALRDLCDVRKSFGRMEPPHLRSQVRVVPLNNPRVGKTPLKFDPPPPLTLLDLCDVCQGFSRMESTHLRSQVNFYPTMFHTGTVWSKRVDPGLLYNSTSFRHRKLKFMEIEGIYFPIDINIGENS